MRILHTATVLALLALAPAAGLTRLRGPTMQPPVRALTGVVRTAGVPVASIAGVRELPDGRLLLNDVAARRLVVFDRGLERFTVIADSTAATGTAYGSRYGGLLPYHGDSTLFVDPLSMTMLLLDGGAKLVRVLATPKPDAAMALTGGVVGYPGFDAQGRLVYRAPPARTPPPRARDGEFVLPVQPDSAPLVRLVLASRRLDTLTFVRIAPRRMSVTRPDRGSTRLTIVVHPFPVVDDWAVLSDGTVAVVRGRDFHVDLFRPDGSRGAGPRIAFDWQRLTDDERVAVIDSMRTALSREPVANPTAIGTAYALETTAVGRAGASPPAASRGAADAEAEVVPVSPTELPDYRPAFAAGGVRADTEGRLWVRTITPDMRAGPVYHVLDRTGRLVARVRLPAGSAVAGFGRGVVFFGTRDVRGVHLHRAPTTSIAP